MSVDEIIIKKIMSGDNLGGYDIECAAIRAHIKRLEAENAQLNTNYHELLYQVEQKYPNESRHETAKRLIAKSQHSSEGPAKSLTNLNQSIDIDVEG